MKKTKAGLLFGLLFGILDSAIMVMQKLTWDANLSAFSLWVVSGFFVATTSIKLKPILKGMLISFLVLLPSTFIIGWQQPLSLIPILAITAVFGMSLGFLVEKFG